MPPKCRRTRQSSGDFGASAELPEAGALPTAKDVIASINFEIEKSTKETKNEKEKEATDIVAKHLVKKYNLLIPKVPILSEKSVNHKVSRLLETAKLFKQNKLKTKPKKHFNENINKLFDIIACSCEFIKCGEGSACSKKEDCSGFHVLCSCPQEKKIPDNEVMYVKDQREKIGLLGGEMIVGGRDKATEEKIKDDAEKKKKQEEKNAKRSAEAAQVEETVKRMRYENNKEDDSNLLEEDTYIEPEESDGFNIPTEKNKETNYTTLDISLFVAEVARYGVPDRPASALWNAAVKCLQNNKCTKNHDDDEKTIVEKLTVDRYKIRRAKEKFARIQKAKKTEETNDGIQCLGTDGKRDKRTLRKETVKVNNIETEKHFVGTEEHIVYTNEPKGDYLTHSAPEDGSGQGLAKDLLEVLAEHNSTESLKAICCDGTATNTGWKSGMLANVERTLQRRLLPLVCQLHGVELPLRHMFDKCDGSHGTTGPNSFGGELGKQAKKELHLEDVVDFEAVETSLEDIPEEVFKSLSRDQKLLYQYINAIRTGQVSPRLATQKAGLLNHSRWLTLAIRLLQLYTRTEAPSDGLRKVVRYIMQVYGPCWFSIKKAKSFTSGPALLFKQMVLIRETQPADVQAWVQPVVQRNGFMAEPGVMLCAMMESSSPSIRRKAVEMVKHFSAKPPKIPRKMVLRGIRQLRVPALQWSAFSWVDMIDWKKTPIHLPHIIECLSATEIDSTLNQPHIFPSFPVHTQTVERAVKLVSEASSKVEGAERRHGHILSVMEARRIRLPFDNKRDYKISE